MALLPKGVYRQRKVLADGTRRTYYRWRATGTRIEGEPGTDEFDANLARIRNTRPESRHGSWAALVLEYRRSPSYRALRANTQRYYDRAIERVRAWEHKMVADIRRADVLVIRDALALAAPQAANQFVMVMSVLMDFAVEREVRETNPLVKLRRIKGGTHRTWNNEQIRYALDHLAEPFRRAIILALYTGQREGDCCAMRWSQYDGTAVEVIQEKTGAHLWIPAHRTLKLELDRWERQAETVLVHSLGRPWLSSSFATMICKRLHEHPKLSGLVFHGLRKSAAARLAEAGCSTHEIAAITGHESLAMVELYTRKADQRRRAVAAINKLELVKDNE